MRIIPAIDIIDGKCVRLTQGNYAAPTTYNANPLEMAQYVESFGLQYLHLVDLDGARQGKITNYAILESIATHTNLKIDFGGGLYSQQDLDIAFSAGASQVTIGSLAIKKPQLCYEWLAYYGSEKIILGADVRQEKIAIAGWQQQTEVSIFELIAQYLLHQIHYVICTDINKDGLLAGVSIELYQKIRKQYPQIALIASGGVKDLQDLQQLAQIGVEGVIIGKAIYEKKINLEDLASFLIHNKMGN